MELDGDELDLAVFLVRHHLLLSSAAQRRDIRDAALLRRMCRLIRSRERLHLLVVGDGEMRAELERLARRQGEILDRAALLVRPGGRLVYATCSLANEENEEVVEAFLRDELEVDRGKPGVWRINIGGRPRR